MKLLSDRDCVEVTFMLISFAYLWLWFSNTFNTNDTNIN